jgi:TonB-linked SusC/RagA family outer membrane protein
MKLLAHGKPTRYVWKLPAKMLLVMKITAFFLLIGTLSSSAKTFSQKVTLTGKDIPLSQVFTIIEKQTGYAFVYDEKTIQHAHAVTLDVKDAPLAEVLNQCLMRQGLTYDIKYQIIVITAAPDGSRRGMATAAPYTALADTLQTIRGRILGENSQPMTGVTVLIEGTAQGTKTGPNGEFELRTAQRGVVTLSISYVGYQTVRLKASGSKPVEVEIKQVKKALDDVVVIGYGTVKKQNVTSAISTIKSDDLEHRAITTLGEGFAGEMAGVQATEVSGGQPGAELNITVRGTGSINYPAQALVVVDGIPSDMIDFNPNDVASVEVLKDAASAAIYGSRVAGGVILITTKQGKKGPPAVNFSSYTGVQKVDKTLDVMNTAQFTAFGIWGKNQDYINQGGRLSDPMSSRPAADQYPTTWLTPDSLPNTDWQKAMYRIAPIQNYQLTVSGGGDAGSFLLSGSYMNQDGILVNSGYQRENFRANGTLHAGKALTFGLNLAPSFSRTDNPSDEGKESALHHAEQMAPIVPLFNSNTQFWGYTPYAEAYVNPLEQVKELLAETLTNSINTNAWGELALGKSLVFRSQYGYNYRESRANSFSPANINAGGPTGGGASTTEWYTTSIQNTLTWQPKLSASNDFDLNLLLGQSAEKQTYYTSYESATGFPNSLINTLNVASTPTAATTDEEKYTLASYFGRLSLGYKNRYLLTINMRQDGSSRFGANTKWGYFPSASAGWKLNEESFLNKVSWVSLLKLRASIGAAGNNNIGNYSNASLLSVSNYNLNNTIVSGLAPSSVASPDLKWETRISRDLGLDFNLFNSRIQSSADVYFDKTKDMLLNVPVPLVSGYSSILENLGQLTNHGWEFEITTVNVKSRNLRWSTSFNISGNANKVTRLGPNNTPIIGQAYSGYAYITEVGKPIGSFYMYKADGILTQADFDNSGKPLVAAAAGQIAGNIRAVDVNKDGKIDQNDLTVVGKPQADFIWGITNRVGYKRFELSFLLQGQKGGNELFEEGRQIDVGVYAYSLNFNQMARWVRAWKPDYTGGQNPLPAGTKVNMSWDGSTPNPFGNNLTYNNTAIYSASFLRIKNIQLSYALSPDLCGRLGLKGVSLFLIGDNVYTWTHYPGTSSESSTGGNTTTAPNSDYVTYPNSRKYTFGLNITL